jgi:hypothetical protein
VSKKPVKRVRGYSDEQRLIDYKIVFNSDAGQRVLIDLMARGHVYGPSVTPTYDGPIDPYQVCFHDGERNLVHTILHYLGMTPADIVKARPSTIEAMGLGGDDADHPLAMEGVSG